MEQQTQDQRTMIATLLSLIWRGVPSDYKSKYRMTIWSQFEAEIKSAAYTSNLGKFINSLCGHLGATPGTTDAERALAGELIETLSHDERSALKLLREQTTYLALVVRIDNQNRRVEWETRQEKEHENV